MGSRRQCEKLILAGKVSIGGKTVTNLATAVLPDAQGVTVDGKPAVLSHKIYLAFNKPAGLVCSRGSTHGEKNIYDLLPAELKNLFYVGRLDRDTEGLLFLTNDGDWAQRVSHPRHEVKKVYAAEIAGRPEPRDFKRAVHGVQDEGETLRVESIRLLGERPRRRGGRMIEVILREGKKREIRRLFRALHHPVIYLKRLQIGDVKLGSLPAGKWRRLTEAEIKNF